MVAGTYSLSARATDNSGAIVTSAPVTVTVTAASNPGWIASERDVDTARAGRGSGVSGCVSRAVRAIRRIVVRLRGDRPGVQSRDGFAVHGRPRLATAGGRSHHSRDSPRDRSSALATASVLQPFTDPTEGRMSASVDR